MEAKTFKKSVITLMTGAASSQVITFLLAPVVSRIFLPEDFSVFEQYVLLLSILSVFSTFRMELAIPRANNDGEAKALVWWCFKRAFSVCLIVLILVLLYRGDYASYLKTEELGFLLLFLPINILAVGCFQALVYWHHRKRQFSNSSTGKVIYSSTNEVSRISLGFLGAVPAGLVYGNLIARTVSVWYLFRKEFSFSSLSKTPKKLIKEVVHTHRKFLNYSSSAGLLGRLATWAHIFLFSHFFGLWSIGFFAISRRLVLGPLGVFSQSFSQVFYQHISELKSYVEFKQGFFKYLLWLCIAAGLMIGIVLMIPNAWYGFVLGDKWLVLGDFMRLLIFWFGLNFITGSLSFTNYRLNKQSQMFFIDALHFILVVSSIAYGFYGGYSEWETLQLFVLSKVIFLLINLIIMIYFVLNSNQEKFNE